MSKALDQQNQGIHPHPLGIHHPNHCRILAGRRVHNRILSCHKHQKSKLYMVPDIAPDIKVLLDIMIIMIHKPSISIQNRIFEYFYNFYLILKKKPLILGPIFKSDCLCHSISLNISPNIEGFLQ